MRLITVLLPVYNGASFLAEAIDSILAQTHRDFELLVVDDGSTDDSASIVRRYRDSRVRLIEHGSNRGLSAALNTGLAAAAGDLVARQDADDLSEPSRLERQLAEIDAAPGLALLGCQATTIDAAGRAIGVVERPIDDVSVRWYAAFDNPFIHTAVMFRTSVVRELGGFDGAFDPFSQDYALWCRVLERARALNLRERLVRYRVSTGSIIGSIESRGDAEYRQRFERIVRELTARYARTLFGAAAVDEDDARLIAGFVLGLGAADVAPFLTLFERLLGEFERRFPGASQSSDFARTLARQYDALAFRVSPPSRRASAAIFASAIGHRPRAAARLSWRRALALVLLGRAGRERLARLVSSREREAA